MIEILDKLQFVGMIFAALLGLAFGSFLNVFLVRFPDGESMVRPRSHCRTCNHTLSWWENLPVLSWIFLKGRCRSCKSGISARYPIVELAVGGLWTGCWVKFCTPVFSSAAGEINSPRLVALCLFEFVCSALLCWLLVALTALDAEYFWLPDVLTLPGIGLGLLYILLRECIRDDAILPANLIHALWTSTLAISVSGGLLLFIRFLYWLIRRREGVGLGDIKLMAMLGAWLGTIGALESFVIATFIASAAALVWLIVLAIRRESGGWGAAPLPLGTFLCVAALSEIFNPHWLWLGLHLDFFTS
jgi:leader peptidase (prepilin peptidase)/N-methyltransferase